jgi:DNA-binding MurR/RpiR family transcriptional regulator
VSDMEVTDRITSAGPQLTAAERRVAQVVLERPQLVAFGTVADLAMQAKAGAATVVRLAGKLGFDGFSALQSSVQADLSRQLRPPVERIRELSDHQPVERHRAIATQNLVSTFDSISRPDLEKVVSLLSDVARPVIMLAGDAEYGVGLQFVHGLNALRAGVSVVGGNEVTVRRLIATSDANSTLLVIDLRRYERWLLETVTMSKELGHTIVALSDGPLSPLAMVADFSFTLAAHSASPFDSHTATLALLELLVAGVAESIRDLAAPRLEQAEVAWRAAGSLTDR